MSVNHDKNSFEVIIKNFSKKKRNFIIERKRSNQFFISDNKVIAFVRKRRFNNKNKQLNKEIISLFGQVQKSVNKYIVKKNFEIPIVENKNSSTWVNRKLYKSMLPNEEFFYVDAAHCFWRIAYLEGLINERLYKNILAKPYLKTYRNMSLSCLIAPKSREYYKAGKPIITITEDKSLHKRIYDNIRFSAYNLVGDVRRKCGDDFLIAYKTDGVICQEDVLAQVIEIIEENNFDVNIETCYKLDDEKYLNDKGKEVRL